MPVVGIGLPRVAPDWAVIHAAQLAVSDRQAALLICLAVQQRLVAPARLLAAWQTVRRSPRRALIDAVIRDVCDGVHSLGELDFARMCRRHGLPRPSHQVVRSLPGGRIYLDVEWEDIGLVVEIDGGQHALALNPVDDALRQNEVPLTRRAVLRIPVVGCALRRSASWIRSSGGSRRCGPIERATPPRWPADAKRTGRGRPDLATRAPRDRGQ